MRGATAALTLVALGGTAEACDCRGSDGRDYCLGEHACIATPTGPRLAQCVMVLNNTSWRVTEQPCPQAGRQTAPNTTAPTSAIAAQAAAMWRPR